MEMLCPACRGTVVVQGQKARCTLCGADFDVLFSRSRTATPTSPAAPPPILPQPGIPPATSAPPSGEVQRITVQCPSCHATLKVAPDKAGKLGRCTCGHLFTIPTPDAVATAVPVSEQAAAKCVQHPGIDAKYACARCHAFICETCAFAQPDGSRLCPTCASSAVFAATASQGRTPWMPAGVMCRTHGSVAAVRYCDKCGAPMCATCDFEFPGNVHLCPTCATAPRTEMSSKRKRRVYWALGLAIWSTVGTVVFLLVCAGATSAQELEVIGNVAGLLVLMPLLVGLGLSLSCFEKNLSNPPIIWVASIWNGVVIAAWILLIIVGLTT